MEADSALCPKRKQMRGVMEQVTERQLELAAVADALETQCCVEIRPAGNMQGVVRPLYLAARERLGGSPTQLAGDALLKAVGKGDVVVVASGFHVPESMPLGETDGPPGAASLAYAISLGLCATPLVLGDPDTMGPIRAACDTIGLIERNLEAAQRSHSSYVADVFPADDAAEIAADDLLSRLQPKAILVVEKPGVNAFGVAHTAGGRRITDGRARIEVLVAKARERGIVTIAVGDNGNEAGLGAVAEATRKHKAFGERCLCDCGGGIATVDEADYPLIGSVSNWAAYGLSAYLAVSLKDERLIHDGETEKRMIHECLRAGAVDGATHSRRFMVDGIPAQTNACVVEILRAIVSMALHPS